MFDDILDPMAPLRRMQQQNYLAQQAASPEQNIRIAPLSEEREQSLLPQIGSAALGGLGAVGSFLEKTFGGRAIRGALGGNFRELLSVLPGSDITGLTDYSQRVSGRDLLRQWGVADKEDNWGNFLGGLALELGTDPGMYIGGLGGKAFTEGGKVAKAIGAVPTTARGRVTQTMGDILKANPALSGAAETAAGGAAKLANVMDQPLAGFASFGIPLTRWQTPILTGKSGEAALDALGAVGGGLSKLHGGAVSAHDWLSAIPYAGKAYQHLTPVGWAGSALKAAPAAIESTGRHLGALLNPRNFDATTAIGQKAAQARSGEILPFVGQMQEKILGWGDELSQLGVKDSDEFRLVLEGMRQHPLPRVNNIASTMRGEYLGMLQEAKRLGVKLDEFMDPFHITQQYGPRQWSAAIENAGALPGSSTASALRATDATLQAGREPILGGIVDGTAGLNKMLDDASVFSQSGSNPATRAAYIRQNYLRDPTTILQEQVAAGLVPQQLNNAAELAKIIAQQERQALSLTKFVDNLPSQFAESAAGTLLDRAGKAIKLKPFGHNPIDEMMNYVQRYGDVRARALASQDLIAENLAQLAGKMPQGGVSLSEAVKRAGLTDNIIYASGQIGPVGASNAILDRVNQALTAAGQQPVTSLSGMYLPAEAATELTRVLKPFQAPEAVNPMVRGLDWLTNLFKTNVTTYWPGFNIRNRMSGAAQNMAESGMLPVGGSNTMASAIVGGKAVPEMLELPGMRQALQAAGRPETAEEAAKQISRWYTAYNVQGHTPNLAREIVTQAGDNITMPRTLDDVMGGMVGQKPKSYKDVIDILRGGQEGTSWVRPFDVAGVNTSRDVFTPVVAGRAAGDIVENMNRMPLFIESLKEGYTPLEAARRTIGTHFAYTPEALTSFEKTIMRRLIPFYSFTRQNLPRTVGRLATNPGGFEGTLARVSEDLRGDGFTPKYMGEGLAIPIGEQTPEGMQRYLNRLDLPADQAFDFFKGFGGDPIQSSIMGLLGQMNPLLKGPVEYAVNKQFFSGRELGDLYSMTGNPLADQILFNSPAARIATTARQAVDSRKDWPTFLANFLTGAKFTDVDIPKYQAIAEREYIKQALQGSPAIGKFETLAVRPDQIGQLSPQQFELIQLQRLLEKRARDAKKSDKVRVQ